MLLGKIRTRHWCSISPGDVKDGDMKSGDVFWQVRTEWGVLPEDQEQRRSHVLNRAIAEMEAGEEDWSSSMPLADMLAEDAAALLEVVAALFCSPMIFKAVSGDACI